MRAVSDMDGGTLRFEVSNTPPITMKPRRVVVTYGTGRTHVKHTNYSIYHHVQSRKELFLSLSSVSREGAERAPDEAIT